MLPLGANFFCQQ